MTFQWLGQLRPGYTIPGYTPRFTPTFQYPSLPSAPTCATPLPWLQSSAQTVNVQRWLNTKLSARGCAPIKVDGVLGPATCGAAGYLVNSGTLSSTEVRAITTCFSGACRSFTAPSCGPAPAPVPVPVPSPPVPVAPPCSLGFYWNATYQKCVQCPNGMQWPDGTGGHSNCPPGTYVGGTTGTTSCGCHCMGGTTWDRTTRSCTKAITTSFVPSTVYGAPETENGELVNPESMQWLGQLGATVTLRGGELYRGRVAYQFPNCQDATTLSAVRQAILSMAKTPQFPVDMQVFTTESSLPADWPDDKKTSTANLQSGECLIFWQGRASSDITVDDTIFTSALSLIPGTSFFPFPVRSIDLWQQPPAGGAPGLPQPPCQPGQVFDPAQNRCVTAPQPTCPAGTSFNAEFGVCIPQVQACGPGQIWWFYEAFVDQAGGGGKCVPAECTGGMVRNPSTGDCIAPASIGPALCPEGFDYDEATELCIERAPAAPPPLTPPPTVPPVAVGECPANASRDQYGNCLCNAGYEPVAGECVPSAAAPPAPAPTVAARKAPSGTAFAIGALALVGVALAALAGRPGA